MTASQIFWSMVASQIFLEHGNFSNFVGTWVFFEQSSCLRPKNQVITG
jgi:hypothetical protein